MQCCGAPTAEAPGTIQQARLKAERTPELLLVGGGVGWGGYQRLEQGRCGGEKMGSRLCGTETSIRCTTLPSSGQNER